MSGVAKPNLTIPERPEREGSTSFKLSPRQQQAFKELALLDPADLCKQLDVAKCSRLILSADDDLWISKPEQK